MQFLSSRSVAFSVMLAGQRMAVMFSERNENGQCSFITHRKDVAEAIRRHSFFKKGVIWEDARDSAGELTTSREQPSLLGLPRREGRGPKGQPLTTEGAQAQPLTAVDGGTETAGNAAGTVATAGTVAANADMTGDGKQDEVHSFGNFSEAKEWFCKTHGVAKTSVKNPTALMAAAEAMGVKISLSPQTLSPSGERE